ncbi:MAG: Zn-dependent hydrolase [Gammaproteobacteria bacterium]|nr:Zn-dependent hydrolase [Gammaproteobacteria bacterium]
MNIASSWNAVEAALADREAFAADLFDRLAAGTRDGAGVTRASYGDGEAFAHELMAETAAGLGLAVETDAAMNTYMTLAGGNPDRPRVVIGSHLDSVRNGGNFDGAAGVVAGLTALAALRDAGVRPSCDISVMGIRAEESAWFGVSYIGSRLALGQLPEGALESAKRSDTGRSLTDHISRAGGDPAQLRSGAAHLDPAALGAYLELHIEQGPVLETEGLPVGIVTGIRGNFRYPDARIIGEYSHCGGVPRDYRHDAVVAAADFVQALDRLWSKTETEGGDMAFTMGKLFTDADQHAMTKISGDVRFSLDVRTLDPAFLAELETMVDQFANQVSKCRGVSFDLGQITRAAVGAIEPEIQEALATGAERLGIPARRMASGAAHDAAAFAAAGVPTAMIFVRNANGSHNPDEAMEIADFMQGTRLMTWWLSQTAPAFLSP